MSAPFSLAVCIRKPRVSLRLPRLSCRNFTFHLSTSGSLMRQFNYRTHSFPSWRKLWTSGSVSQTTAVHTPPRCVQIQQGSSSSGLPCAMQSAVITTLFFTVSLMYLISRDLFETKDLSVAFSPTARSSAFPKGVRGVHPGLHRLQDLSVGLSVICFFCAFCTPFFSCFLFFVFFSSSSPAVTIPSPP